MSKKVLKLAVKGNMIQQFNYRNIKILQNLGYEIHVATNMVDFRQLHRFHLMLLSQGLKPEKVSFMLRRICDVQQHSRLLMC